MQICPGQWYNSHCISYRNNGTLWKGKCETLIKLSGSIEIAEESGSSVRQFIMDYREFKDLRGK